jgi:hypothetical protein
MPDNNRRKSFSTTASSTINELFDCSAVSQSTAAVSGRRNVSSAPSDDSNAMLPSGVST